MSRVGTVKKIRAKITGLFLKPVSLLARHVPAADAKLDDAKREERRGERAEVARIDHEKRKARRAAKHALRVRLGGRYKIKGSDARKLAAQGRMPSHVRDLGVTYITQFAPRRSEGPRKHRSAQAYRKRQEKRAVAQTAALDSNGTLRGPSAPLDFGR